MKDLLTRSRVPRLLLALAALASPLALSASPGSFDWATFNSRGSIDYGVYDADNDTILETGDLAQLIWVGPNGTIDPPKTSPRAEYGEAGGDDVRLDTSAVQNTGNLWPIQQNKGYIPYKIYTLDSLDDYAGKPVYIRAWNDASASTATAYGNSTLHNLNVGEMYPWPRWYTNVPITPTAVDLAYFTATAEPDHVLLAWETVSEIDHRGFNIYRANDEAGPWTQVNATLIPAQAPGSSAGHAYTWTDAAAMPGTTWYQLEDVSLSGRVTRHDPVCVTVAGPNAVGLSRIAGATTATWPAVGLLLAVVAAAAVARRRMAR